MNTLTPKNVQFNRSALLVFSTIGLTGIGCALLWSTYSDQPIFWSDYLLLILFPLLFSQLALACLLGLFGFGDWLRGGDPFHIMRRPWKQRENSVPLVATAIVIPVFNEDVERLSRGIENMWLSLTLTGQIEHFDLYICSDSSDVNHWIEEECAWLKLAKKHQAFGKIFYRKRHHSINGKSGNVADFCRRWGKLYRYMILLDADSIMSGSSMVRLVRAMESNPQVGILQTQPAMVLGRSFFRRVLQFSHRVYGKILTQGSSLAQMSAASYWGHNAIIRIAPFMEYCALPSLPVPDEHSRHILSHDTIEAALMQKAGYEVWVAYDEPDSYEEGPPNLSDMLKRDRRWCAGNLQHFWFLFARGVRMGNRLQIWIGLMSYLCSPIWLLFLVAGLCSAYQRTRFLTYSADPQELAAAQGSGGPLLLVLTLILLFLPRVFGVIAALPRQKDFGGLFPLFWSTGLDTLFSFFLAPVLMLFHTVFVFETILGWQTIWTTQNRTDQSLSFSHCLRLYGWQTVLGLLTQLIVGHYLGFNWWCLSITGAWFLAPVTAWLSSSIKLGQWFQSHGGFVIPEELAPPTELQGLPGQEDRTGRPFSESLWIQALLCPYVQALHLSMAHHRTPTAGEEKSSASLVDLREQLLRQGPGGLKIDEKQKLLWDGESVSWLHQELWSRPDADLHPFWLKAQSACCQNPLLSLYLRDSVS